VPGDLRPAFEHSAQARQVLNDAEEDLREWQPSFDPIHSSATDMGPNLMPASVTGDSTFAPSVAGGEDVPAPQQQQVEGPEAVEKREISGSTVVQGEGYQQQQFQK
ncbi:MAG: hypothetical protein Q9213_007921, partial [Squamulea squamosa]